MWKLMVALLLMPTAVAAAPRDEVYAASHRCAGISDDHAWLDCYYGAAQPMRQQLHLTPAPATQQALVTGLVSAPTPAMPRTSSGPVAARKGGLFGGGTLEANIGVRAYNFDKDRKFIIVLANGEVWKQAPEDGSKAEWTKPPAFYEVSIRQSGGINMMEIRGDGQSYRVEHVQ